eukprot:TRINITY_DN4282_c0_g1_i1.p1 TRINITY_DN4282_c0_g1~~TRINITY_DN4282_c0_g1_i1.p1  ORF type:complete len:233 (+),score=3.15 TRINITY_DN4282_c0_g1_i1:80-778(+)
MLFKLMATRFGSWGMRKNEASSTIKSNLAMFILPLSNGEFSASRVRSYKYMQKMFVVPNAASSVRCDGLKSVFYARYYTIYNLVQDPPHSLRNTDGLKELQDFFLERKSASPTHGFKLLVDKEIRRTLRLTSNEVETDDSFKRVLSEHCHSGDMADKLLSFERTIFKVLKEDPKSNLHSHFNLLNRETQHYTIRLLSSDITYLKKAPERTKDFMESNKIPIAILLTILALLL